MSQAEGIHRVFDTFDTNKCKRVENYFGWVPLVWPAYKLNTDGGRKALGLALIGELIKHAHGELIECFSMNIRLLTMEVETLYVT